MCLLNHKFLFGVFGDNLYLKSIQGANPPGLCYLEDCLKASLTTVMYEGSSYFCFLKEVNCVNL